MSVCAPGWIERLLVSRSHVTPESISTRCGDTRNSEAGRNGNRSWCLILSPIGPYSFRVSSVADTPSNPDVSSPEAEQAGGAPAPGAELEGVIDVLGALACGEMSAFERMAADSRMAPTLSDKAALAGMAAAEFGHFRSLCARLREFGIDPEEAMQPFVAPLDTFHDLTAPKDWLESLVKAYVGDGIARDFYREVSAYMDPRSRDLVREVLADMGQAAFAVDRVRAAIDANPAVGGGWTGRPSCDCCRHRPPTSPNSGGCSSGSSRHTPSGCAYSACPADASE